VSLKQLAETIDCSDVTGDIAGLSLSQYSNVEFILHFKHGGFYEISVREQLVYRILFRNDHAEPRYR
jgi:hypothetical protein